MKAKIVALLLVLSLTGCGASSNVNKSARSGETVVLDISDHQTFNDTDSDGYGEFQGWGTSLCWWANRVGYSDELTKAAADAFFDREKGLGLNIGRYNIGGGDNVTDGAAATDGAIAADGAGTTDGTSATDAAATAQGTSGSDFLHEAHIKRSDSIVPGYAMDVTKIDLSANTKEYYEQNFARADFECGYAWNYNWYADGNQLSVLEAAKESYGEDFIVEAFSNSPPYFMTVTGCSSGSPKGSTDNLREDSYHAFATYLADVTQHLIDSGIADVQSISPMNEPATNYWTAFSEKQEGCHFSPGKSQSNIIVALDEELKSRGMDIVICGSDETSINTAISSFNKLSDQAKEALDRIDTHSYMGDKRSKLKETALGAGKNLWMSEVDGTYSLGKGSGAMEAALGFADAIMTDVNGMYPSAWIMWNAADMHIDSNNEFDTLTRAEADRILSEGEPFWGIAIADHDSKELLLGKKYYGFGQFTRYIKPGYCIIGSGKDTLAAFDPNGNTVVIVSVNSKSNDVTKNFDLGCFDGQIESVEAIRTSGDMESGENWRDVSDYDEIAVNEGSFSALLKGYSITTYIVKLVS